MQIVEIKENKERYIDLLPLADEQEDMIDRYLERGTLYGLDDAGVKGVCVVTDEGDSVMEIKNLAVAPTHQRKGYGRKMIEFIAKVYQDRCCVLQVGTGDSPLTVPFYQKCGFAVSHRIKNFFTEHDDHPIVECGVQHVDMVCLRKRLN